MTKQLNPPAFTASRFFELRKGPKGIIRIHNSRIDGRKKDRMRFHRHQAVVLTTRGATSLVVRSVAGTPDGFRLPVDGVALDYDAIDALQLRGSGTTEVVIRPATWMELCISAWHHSDPAVRVSMWLAVFGALTGIIGLVGMLF